MSCLAYADSSFRVGDCRCCRFQTVALPNRLKKEEGCAHGVDIPHGWWYGFVTRNNRRGKGKSQTEWRVWRFDRPLHRLYSTWQSA